MKNWIMSVDYLVPPTLPTKISNILEDKSEGKKNKAAVSNVGT